MFKKTLLISAFFAISTQFAMAEYSTLPEMTLYKDPNCGCCGGHAEYLKQKGVKLKVVNHPNVIEIKQKYGTLKGASCHTIVMDGYVIEGHVPIDSIQKLWEEQPDIRGIALPGMPFNSPGMGPEKKGSLTIMQVSNNGDVDQVFNIE